jgi:hypothetical protein
MLYYIQQSIMNIDNIIKENEILTQENEILKQENTILKEHLKKYTAPSRSKTYYENHKEELLNKMKNYTPSPEKIKEKNRKAYLKRKDKNKEIEKVDNNENK